MLYVVVPLLLFRLILPRPSASIAYVPPVKSIVSTPEQLLMSSTPTVIRPLPSAVKLPIRPNATPDPLHSSVPVIEKAYFPDKVAFENLAGGGGGGGFPPPPPDDPPPHPAMTSPRDATAHKIFRTPFTAHRHVACPASRSRQSPHAPCPPPSRIHAANATPASLRHAPRLAP